MFGTTEAIELKPGGNSITVTDKNKVQSFVQCLYMYTAGLPWVQFLISAELGSVAEWSKALVLGTSHFDGVGSNPTTANSFLIFCTIIRI